MAGHLVFGRDVVHKLENADRQARACQTKHKSLNTNINGVETLF